MTTRVLPQVQCPNRSDLQKLIALSAEGLIPMFDAAKHVFCHRMVSTEKGLIRIGISYRYTIIALLGLHRLRVAGLPLPFDIQPTIDHILQDATWLENLGDLGLLLWLCALTSPHRLPDFCSHHALESAVNRYRDGREQRTMELSWFLSGLSHAVLAEPKRCHPLTDLARSTFSVLKKNQGPHGVFCHQRQGGGVAGLLRGRIGSFADQVYPIYAMAVYSQTFQNEESLRMASACADAICRMQGLLGQWWWHYDSKTGKVVGKYPVYSVHQHGMGPMALFALGEAAQRDFTGEIYRGLDWIYGANELNTDMRDALGRVIWRCVRPTGPRRYFAAILSLLRVNAEEQLHRDLHVLHECWPYELGWLLYAFASRNTENAERPATISHGANTLAGSKKESFCKTDTRS